MSTNPYYEGNSEGVIAHLNNTVNLVLRELPNYTVQAGRDQIRDAVTNAVTQRWHLTPARDANFAAPETAVQESIDYAEENVRLVAENEKLARALVIAVEASSALAGQAIMVDKYNEGVEVIEKAQAALKELGTSIDESNARIAELSEQAGAIGLHDLYESVRSV